MRNRIFYPFMVLIMMMLAGCSEDEPVYSPPDPPLEGVGEATVWVTSGNRNRLLEQDSDIIIYEGNQTELPFTAVKFDELLQQIEGYGAALTGSSAWLINRQMNAAQRQQLLIDMFHPDNGIGVSYLRLPMGASDFSLSNYTYNDLLSGQTDPDLELFSIASDRQDIIPVLKQILDINPQVKIMGSPWSAPAWMKTSGSLMGGRLRQEWYDTYALYFVKFVQAYAEEGITIDAISVQNEPLHETSGYPSMLMPAEEQNLFIRDHLGPLFSQHDITTKIIIYDHNWDRPDYPLLILSDPVTRNYVAGSAFHAYAGNVSAMGQVHALHPDKGLYFTEVSGGGWATDFSDNLKWKMSNIFIGTANNWSKNALLWNLALDPNDGPTNGGCQNCRGVVTILPGGGVERNEEFYALAHMSKFVKQGARRATSSSFASSENLESVAFLNPDGSRVLVVLNKNSSQKSFAVKYDDNIFEYRLEGNAVATIIWE
ncbi:MAG: glucan endo-1,6-beta-glucosidase [Bacteroidetes bacterium]|nr:MAG: glucan endo-1,6-beta-glucosidase [Bacteroidota bacterium]